jgi:aerobic carbon-monoxide dehydrogenase medium subunit
VADTLPLIAQAVLHVAHPAIRNRGTFGGSLAHADPAAELPAVALLLGATMVIRSGQGERRIEAADFFHGMFATALKPGELLWAAEFPLAAPDAVFAFAELARRQGDFAIAGIAARAVRAGGTLRDMAFVGFGIADRPTYLPSVAKLAVAALPGLPHATALKEALAGDVEILPDNTNSPAMKAHVTAELILAALADLGAGGLADG